MTNKKECDKIPVIEFGSKMHEGPKREDIFYEIIYVS